MTFWVPTTARGADGTDLTSLTLSALSDDSAVARGAIASLRDAGPDGLAALAEAYRAAIDRHRADPLKAEPMWDRLSAALDAVAAQKDAWASGLYWYTDLEKAKAAAAASGKPILSLRLLGTLDTEFSCANSRFFRTALYPNGAVQKYLRENFVLHWQSHRPVPRLTIDFGDGRVIERTITGNSVHYVLTSDGRVVDVIPGLYGAAAFLRAVTPAHDVAVSAMQSRVSPAVTIARYHAGRLAELRRRWNEDLRAVGVLVGSPSVGLTVAQPSAAEPTTRQQPAGLPLAPVATRIALSKSAIEIRPVLAVVADRGALAATTSADDATWAKVAALHAADATMDAGSRAVIVSKAGPDAVKANLLTAAKRKVEDPVTRLVRNFERSVAEDSVRNEYLLHGQVHEWFVAGTAPASLDELNEQVYARLFLMPKSDPFLGLVAPDTYTGLPADVAARR
jgi:hypothetical protein